MKYTIEGFSQEFALTLRKDVEVRGKITTKKIDCTDLVILRWFVDFYPNMQKITVDGEQYAFVTHKKLLEDLPLIDINKRAFMDRMQKLVDFNILTYRLLREGGTYSLYGFGENYANLVRSNDIGYAVQTTQGMLFEQHRVCCSNDIGYAVQTAYKDNSIIYSSIKDKERKKERKKESFDELINDFCQRLDVSERGKTKELLCEWLKVRKAKRAAMTDKAIELNLKKLVFLAKESNLTIEKYLEEIIMRGWQAFYPIKDFTTHKEAATYGANGVKIDSQRSSDLDDIL